MDLGLRDKVAMVSGGSNGLGFAVAQALAAEGARVSLGSSDAARSQAAAKRLEQATGTVAMGMLGDVRSSAAIAAWHAATAERLGPVDLLFINSGGPPAGAFAAIEEAAWRDAFELLVLGAIRLARAVLPGMLARGRGAILVSTSSSVKEPIANLTLSNVLRPSVAALAKSLAAEAAGRGVRVNQLIPGRIATARIQHLDQVNSQRLGISQQEQETRMKANIPLGRYGDPAEFGRAAAFLLSDAASYITGATLQVDGGLIRAVL